jgi:hypothetical protein
MWQFFFGAFVAIYFAILIFKEKTKPGSEDEGPAPSRLYLNIFFLNTKVCFAFCDLFKI